MCLIFLFRYIASYVIIFCLGERRWEGGSGKGGENGRSDDSHEVKTGRRMTVLGLQRLAFFKKKKVSS